ncbi:DpnII restriction endonuclease [Thiovulum sp. ES]|nr:DpnII restriction endonuclease [Thiovulum sp. ES]
MQLTISKIFKKNSINFKEEVEISKFPEITSMGVDLKIFDFVIEKEKITYLIEVNFYNSGGSKLNEVARACTDIAPKIDKYDNYKFVWITDGQGWLSAKNKLEEAFNNIPHLYNLNSLESFLQKVKNEI